MSAALDQRGYPGHAAPHRGLVAAPLLWFGVFGAPAAWAAQLISNYALMAHFCYPVSTPLASPEFGGVRLLAILISAGLLVVAVAALAVALRSWSVTRHETARRRSPPHHEAAETGEGRTRFMAMSGILVSAVFTFGVLMASVPLLTMPICVF